MTDLCTARAQPVLFCSLISFQDDAAAKRRPHNNFIPQVFPDLNQLNGSCKSYGNVP